MNNDEKIVYVLNFIDHMDGKENTYEMASDILPTASQDQIDRAFDIALNWDTRIEFSDEMEIWDAINDYLDTI